MSGLPPACKEIAARLAGDFRQLAGRLHEITAGAADGSRKVGQILVDRDLSGRPAFPQGLGSHGFHGIATSDPEVPRPGEDGPVMLGGRQALDGLISRYGDRIVFHGSAEPIHRLEPRQMTWVDSAGRRYPDGEPAICVDTGYDIPMFLSLFKGRARCVYRATEDGGVSYGVEGVDTASLGEYTGYVHVLDGQYFQEVHPEFPDGWPSPAADPRPAELRSTAEVEPFAIVKVTTNDFPHPIHDFEAIRHS